jgi:KDO2-lipid IV(A) lauroyltransferase
MYFALKALAAVLSSLPEGVVSGLARLIAWLVFDVFRLRRGLMLKNLKIAVPEMAEKERHRIARASVENFALTAFELFRSMRHDIAGHIDVTGVEHIQAALAQGRGVYILCFHLGNWEAMGAKITRTLAPAYVLVKKVGHGATDKFVSELRAHNGFLTVKRQKKGDGFIAIKDVLSRNEIVGFVMDQARPGEPKLPFFGVPAKTNTSFAAIWRRQPAPIIPSYIRRTKLGHHMLQFFPEVVPAVTADADADILRHSSEFNAVVERHVRDCPEQYFWMHNRWK